MADTYTGIVIGMIELKTVNEIDAMRAAGQVVAAALTAARAAATAGMSLAELDEVAAAVIADAGAKPSFLGYRPSFADRAFPGNICASVNDVVVHGIPDGYRLAEGDLLSIDCGAHIDGWHGDSAVSFVVGPASTADRRLIDTAERALGAGIDAALVGGRLGDISAAIGAIGREAGYGMPEGWGGHGIGRAMHEAPEVPNTGRAGRGMRLRAGLVLALEPMFLAGGVDDYWLDEDGWSLRTADRSRAAHVEHTVAITADGPVVLTAG